MPINATRLRKWFAVSGTLLLLVVVGFYSYARYRVRRAINKIPAKLGVNIQQSTSGFTFSKSEGGKTLFSVSAGKAVQYKQGERAKLNDVRIIVYGRDGSGHYDQIYGKEFDYDPTSGDVTATGEVHIDLEATGKPPTLTEGSQESVSPRIIHLRTSALTFNQKTGVAQTSQEINFAMPQGNGSAMGAHYDTKSMSLTLLKDVRINTTASSKNQKTGKPDQSAAEILAENAVISDEPRQAFLKVVRVTQKNQKFFADAVTISLREDNSVSAVKASGNVRSSSSGKTSTDVHSKTADFTFGGNNAVSSLVLNGEVLLNEAGSSSMQGSAGRVLVTFAGKNDVQKIRASEHVHIIQSEISERANKQNATAQTTQMTADAVDFYFTSGRQLQRAETSGSAQLELNSNSVAAAGAQAKRPLTRTTLTAGKFNMSFAAHNRIKSLFGSPNVRMVSSTAGQPDRVSTSRDFTATFDPVHNGALTRVTQAGDFGYNDGPRSASGDSADYEVTDDAITLTGAPRFQDKDSGLTMTAQRLRMNRAGQNLSADGDVKTTYEATKRGASANGGLLSSGRGEAVHVTADEMSYTKSSGIARYISRGQGRARLWQGADIVQAPVIVFDQNNGTLTASSSDSSQTSDKQLVKLSFSKADKNGKLLPVSLSGSRLTYSDKDRQARLEGPVEMKMPDATMSAKRLEVFLRAKDTGKQAASGGPSQIDRAIAHQDIVIEQKNPARRATGDTLVYTAADEKFVLTGTSGKPPSIFDAEHGNVTGDSLTFYNHDDRVQVGGSDSSRTVTRTRVKNESKP